MEEGGRGRGWDLEFYGLVLSSMVLVLSFMMLVLVFIFWSCLHQWYRCSHIGICIMMMMLLLSMLLSRYPIYTCIGMQERDLSWQSSYKMWPSGVCHRVVSVTENLNVAHWANVTGGFADKWNHLSDSFDSKSWERVANDEMWHSKYDLSIVMNVVTSCVTYSPRINVRFG